MFANPIRWCPRGETQDLCVCVHGASPCTATRGGKRKGANAGTGCIGAVQIYADATLMSAEAYAFPLGWTSGHGAAARVPV